MPKLWTQFYPPSPTFTEKNLGSLSRKVFIVTGGNAGIGFELVRILYSKGGTIYIASRSADKIASAIRELQSVHTATPGVLESLVIDLSDLTTVKKCVSNFLAKENRLDVLWNNAGIAQVTPGSLSAQGYEAHMGTNCLGPFLMTKLLLPILIRTAKSSANDSVRVIFTSSSIVDMNIIPGGLSLQELLPGSHSMNKARNYSASKARDWLLASEFSKRVRDEGIIYITQNPRNLKTNSWNGIPVLKLLLTPVLYEPIMGAYTELWAGPSVEVKADDDGRFAVPWGRWHQHSREDVIASLRTKEEGGTSLAAEFGHGVKSKQRSMNKMSTFRKKTRV